MAIDIQYRKDRSLTVQEAINFYMKLIPKPKTNRNIINLQFTDTQKPISPKPCTINPAKLNLFLSLDKFSKKLKTQDNKKQFFPLRSYKRKYKKYLSNSPKSGEMTQRSNFPIKSMNLNRETTSQQKLFSLNKVSSSFKIQKMNFNSSEKAAENREGKDEDIDFSLEGW